MLIAPQPVPGITWARAAHESPRGRIAVSWKIARDIFNLEVDLPPNTSAEVSIPRATAATITEGGRPAGTATGVRFVRQEGDHAVLAVESGHYVFSSPYPRS